MNENICAISTSLGVGAISIVRCSGPDVVEIVNSIFKGKDLTKVDSHTINYGHIFDNDEVIDEVLVSVMLAPKTFTMEDVVEINSHGGIATTNRVLELLLENGCRLAEPGEFTKKAFLNGRIDLVEAEAVNDLIEAETDESRKYAMNRVEGNLSKLIKADREILVNLQASLEVNFDYPEYDAEDMTHELVLERLIPIRDELQRLLATAKDGSILKNGIDVAIVGKPNVGKSSILNHLLDQKKAIVTNIAGTTRDIVEGTITLDGIKLNLIDTAGIRETEDIVERIGVDRSIEAINKADLAIYVLNNNELLTNEDIERIDSIKDIPIIIFVNKSDLETNIDLSIIKNKIIVRGNTITPTGLDDLKDKIKELFNFQQIKSKDYNYLSNARQKALVSQALKSVEAAIVSSKNQVPLEMVAVDLKDAFDSLGEVIGVSYREELLDQLFSNFCLGK